MPASTSSASPPDLATPTAKEDSRAALLRAACRLFSERGYDGASLRTIEAAAGLNRGLATYHFHSKGALWKAAVDSTFAPFLADLESKKELLQALEPAVRRTQLIRLLVVASARLPYLNQLMIQESLAKTWRIEWIIERYLRPLGELRTEIHGDDPVGQRLGADPHLHYALLGASALVFSLTSEAAALYGVDPLDDAFVQRHADVVSRLFAQSVLEDIPEDSQ